MHLQGPPSGLQSLLGRARKSSQNTDSGSVMRNACACLKWEVCDTLSKLMTDGTQATFEKTMLADPESGPQVGVWEASKVVAGSPIRGGDSTWFRCGVGLVRAWVSGKRGSEDLQGLGRGHQ